MHFPSGSTTADSVYGQKNSFTTNRANINGVSAMSLSQPAELAADKSGGVYIADQGNDRVLHYSAGSTTADRVYGQLGNFRNGSSYAAVVSAATLWWPSGIAPDSSGGLYVQDTQNNRVLHYHGGSWNADRVYGQNGSYTTGSQNLGGVSATSLSLVGGAFGVAIDGGGGLYVTDDMHRVLHYPPGSTIADRVYGQLGDFTASLSNNGGLSADSLSAPRGLAVDAADGLFIADQRNNRVLHYPHGSTTADVVYGQGGSFSSSVANLGGVGPSSLNHPFAVSVDSAGGLYVADQGNIRVLHYPAGSTVADVVYGQGGSFTSNTVDLGGVTASSLAGC
jgi:hypothetical protein